MEQNQRDDRQSLFHLNLDPANSVSLAGAASWAKMLAIAGFVFAALCVVFGVIVKNTMNAETVRSSYNDELDASTATLAGNFGMLMYMIMAIIIAVSSVFALNFSKKISRALKGNDEPSLISGFGAVRNFFAFWAILVIISAFFMLIGLTGILAGGGQAAR